MRKTTLILLFLSAVLSTVCGCAGSEPQARGNAVYFWKTSFSLDSEEMLFLEKYDIKKMYVRMFDVNLPADKDEKQEPVPIATTKFKSQCPEGVSIVPVVYITISALKKMEGDVNRYAGLIYSRLEAMMSFNALGPLTEIQLDCDWTEGTGDLYFRLCKAVSALCAKDSVALSSTIRLHQLRQTPPPVDKGVLMLYNTGDIAEYKTANSILDADDVRKYLGSKVNYPLQLDFAYPIFKWAAVFRSKRVEGEPDKGNAEEFSGIFYDVDRIDFSELKEVGWHKYRSDRFIWCWTCSVFEGDVMRLERSVPSVIKEVKSIAEEMIPGFHNSVIYHLDSGLLKDFSDDDFRKIYNMR